MIFGRLTVIEPAEDRLLPSGKWVYQWKCRCSCGGEIVTNTVSLVGRSTRSCGCLQKETSRAANTTHGLSRPKDRTGSTYMIWAQMIQRCTKPTNKRYARYGARGIFVCTEWMDNYENFYRDMGPRPDGTSLDRIDNNGPYSKGNCRWATISEQSNNKSTNAFMELDGVRMTKSQWARKLGAHVGSIQSRLNLGWSVRDTLTKPFKKYNYEQIEI